MTSRPDSEDDWRRAGLAFDRSARDYEHARPNYPDEVFELLRERCGLGPGARVLEIGPGSGIATLPMLERGAHVTAVEPGSALAERLTERAGDAADLEVIVSTLEQADVPEATFDLVVSATAFHWVDPAVGLPKSAELLVDGGFLALWWTIFGDDARPDPFHEALKEILEIKAPELVDHGQVQPAYALDTATRIGEIDATELFGPVEQRIVKWEGRHDAIGMRRFFSTVSPWLALPEALFTELLDDIEALARDRFGGEVVRPYQTVVYSAQRRAR